MAPKRAASKPRSRSRRPSRGVTKKKAKTGAFLNFVRSLRDLFPGHTPARLKHESKALWKEMDSSDKAMYDGKRGQGRMDRSRSRGRYRSRSRSRSRRRRSRSRRRRSR